MILTNIIEFAKRNNLEALAGELLSMAERVDAIHFDEEGYLFSNPDVAEAAANGMDPYCHWLAFGRPEGRIGSGLSPYSRRRITPFSGDRQNPHVVYYGPLEAKSGLGSAARGYVKALEYSGLSFEAIDSTAALYPNMQFPPIAEQKKRADVVIIHHNADALRSFFNKVSPTILDAAYVIGIWVWEMPALDAHWVEHFAAVDEIWTPSQFSADAIQCLAPPQLPVLVVPHVVEINGDKPEFGRSHFGIPEDAFVFLFAFDASSGMDRKNPEALVDAFKSAFVGREDVILVLKCHSSGSNSEGLRYIRKAADSDQVVLIDNLLSDSESESLKKICDAFVSPHRSEGFGLNIAEMMALGKPVVATGYSGNLQYCTKNNAFLLEFDLVEKSKEGGPYPVGGVWASPRRDNLIAHLKAVATRAKEVQDVAERGRRSIEENLSVSRIATILKDRIGADADLEQALDARQLLHKKKSGYVWRHPLSRSNFVDSYADSLVNWPKISVIVPVYNVPASYLEACVSSVVAQTYPYWELCLCDDGSTLPETIDALEAFRGGDSRIRIKRLTTNVGISDCSNEAVQIAMGSYVAFLDNDDTLAPTALMAYARAIREKPEATFFYCDEDKISATGEYIDHYLKPDWSPEHLESSMYVLHMIVVKKSRFLEIGGYRKQFSGAQDYDLALRLSLSGDQFVHIPEVLYHWRMIEGSASAKVDAKPTALIHARAALDEYAKAKFGDGASALDGKLFGHFRVTKGRRKAPPVTLLITTNNGTRDIPGRGKINLVENFVASIVAKTNYPNYRIVVVSNGDLSAEFRQFLAANGHIEAQYSFEGSFNFASKANFAFDQAATEHVVLLNDDMEVISPDWLWSLVDYIDRSEIGVVGAKLLYPDGRLQHAGVAIGVNDTAAHIYHGHPGDTIGYNGYPSVVRNYSAVTGACMATKKSVLREVGGFDECFKIDFNDTDFCLRVRQAGYRVVYTPFCELYHFESQTAVRSTQNSTEKEKFLQRWASVIKSDPYYNPNFRKDTITFEANPAFWAPGRFEIRDGYVRNIAQKA